MQPPTTPFALAGRPPTTPATRRLHRRPQRHHRRHQRPPTTLPPPTTTTASHRQPQRPTAAQNPTTAARPLRRRPEPHHRRPPPTGNQTGNNPICVLPAVSYRRPAAVSTQTNSPPTPLSSHRRRRSLPRGVDPPFPEPLTPDAPLLSPWMGVWIPAPPNPGTPPAPRRRHGASPAPRQRHRSPWRGHDAIVPHAVMICRHTAHFSQGRLWNFLPLLLVCVNLAKYFFLWLLCACFVLDEIPI